MWCGVVKGGTSRRRLRDVPGDGSLFVLFLWFFRGRSGSLAGLLLFPGLPSFLASFELIGCFESLLRDDWVIPAAIVAAYETAHCLSADRLEPGDVATKAR